MAKQYNQEDTQFLKSNCSKMNAREMSIALGRTKQSIWAKLRLLGLKCVPAKKRSKIWTAEKEKLLVENYQTANLKELAKELGVKYGTLLERANKLGFSRLERKSWTTDECNLMIKYLNERFCIKEVASFLNRKPFSLYVKLKELGISVKSFKSKIKYGD